MACDAKRKGREDEPYRDVVIPVLYGWRASTTHFFYGGRAQSNVIELSARPPKADAPVELAVCAMQNSSRPGDVVLDTHVSLGATVIAAEKLDRRLVGYVRSARDMDRVRARWAHFVHGEKANWRTKTTEVT